MRHFKCRKCGISPRHGSYENQSKLCFIVNNKEDDDREIPILSDEEAEMLKMGNRTFSEYSRCVQKNKIEDGQKTEQTSLVRIISRIST